MSVLKCNGVNVGMNRSAFRRAVLAAAVAVCASTCCADVFTDVLGFYCGGTDSNGDGIVQPSEIKDMRRYGVADANSHKITNYKDAYESANKWATNETVQLPNAGISLEGQSCINFTTI